MADGEQVAQRDPKHAVRSVRTSNVLEFALEGPGKQEMNACRYFRVCLVLILVAGSTLNRFNTCLAAGTGPKLPISILTDLLQDDKTVRLRAREELKANWDLAYVPMILEMLLLLPSGRPRSERLWRVLSGNTKRKIPLRSDAWYRWIWNQEIIPHSDYPVFKAQLYREVHPSLSQFFHPQMKHTIRLDEILWGGVKTDGIPPLEHPRHISAGEAGYLGKRNIVFGVFINGEARAYPKRILAWHELFNDTIGGVDVTCAYCTLCGAAVLYRQQVEQLKFDFGTSGFLYRSNKLMYDRQTKTLWSALEGIPVAGPLAGGDLRLQRLPIVTTTWESWRQRHPETRVLSLDTGHDRDYGEGVAYRDYFRTDDLMFPVPHRDDRLKNKQEVVALFLSGVPVAFDAKLLHKKQPLHHDKVGFQELVLLTDRSGATRVYRAENVTFVEWDRDSELLDSQGGQWRLTEEALLGPEDRQLTRLPAHRAFWFGWFAQFPNTRLVTE